MSDCCDRTGLYIMVFVILLSSCETRDDVEAIKKVVDTQCHAAPNLADIDAAIERAAGGGA